MSPKLLKIFVCFSVLLLIQTTDGVTLDSVTPITGPFQGGTLLHITGTGLTANANIACQLRILNIAVISISDSIVHNSTHMSCTMPPITDSLHVSAIESNDNRIALRIVNAMESINLTLFDLENITVTGIEPSFGYNTNETTVSIRGSGFVNTSTITCNFNSHSTAVEFVNSSHLLCHMPSYPVPAQIMINLYLNGQPVSQVTTSSINVTLFTYFSTPPRAVRCEFTASYTSLLLSFDREIEIGSEINFNMTISPNCTYIFDEASIVRLGNEPFCLWLNSQQRDIVITLPSTTSVYPGLILHLNPTSLRTRYVAFSKHASGNITVQTNRLVLNPVAVLEHPQFIPYCGNITLSGVSSQYGGPAPFLYQWNISATELISNDETSSGSATTLGFSGNGIEFNTLTENIPDGFTRQSAITILSDAFSGHYAYTVTLTVRNFLGLTDSKSVTLLKETSPAAPVVQIIGGTRRLLYVNEMIIVQAKAVIPNNCNIANSSLTFQWKVKAIDNTSIPLAGLRLNSPVLLLPADTLSVNKEYQLTAIVTTGNTKISSNTSMSVYILSHEAKAVIQGGTFVVYSEDDNIILDLSPSSGLTNSSVIAWQCYIFGTNDSCAYSNDSSVKLNISPVIQTYIPAFTLMPGQYTITASILYNATVLSMTTQTVAVKKSCNHELSVNLMWPLQAMSAVLIHDKLMLSGIVVSEQSAVIQWRSIYKPGYAHLPLDSISTLSSSTVATSLESLTENNKVFLATNANTSQGYANPISLVIPPGQLLPDNRYKFQLSVVNSQGCERYAEVDIRTASLPSAGTLEIVPSTGIALKTRFHLQALGWTDDIGDLPLYYRFGFSLNKTSDTVWMTGISESSQHSTMLPLPSPDMTIIVVLEIYDRKGAKSVVTQSVTLTLSNLSIDLMKMYNDLYTLSVDQKNWSEGLSSVIAILWSLNSESYSNISSAIVSEAYISVFKQSSIDLAIYLLSSQLPSTKDSVERVLIIFDLCLVDSQISSDVISPILSALETIVSGYLYENNSNPFTSKGISSNEAKLIIRIYDQLFQLSDIAISDRIRSNDIVTSFQRSVYKIGIGVCRQLGLYEESVLILSKYFGTLKIYHTNPPWSYNVTCSNEDSRCPFSLTESPSVAFGENVFQEYVQSFCFHDSKLGNRTKCEGVCIITTQLLADTHWSGNSFANYIKTYPVKTELVSMNGSNGLLIAVTSTLPLFLPSSQDGTRECVHWNEALQIWSNSECQTNILSSQTVDCICPLSKEIAVIDRCPSGFYGLLCNEVCPQGLWGTECSRFCQCSRQGTCSQINGVCDCDSGWTGNMCQTECQTSYWGKRCSERCLCENGAACNHIDGSCSCSPGWIGTFCNESCTDGFYGENCSSVCACRNTSECHSVTGNCTCDAGYIGATCHDICPDGLYGTNCTEICNCDENCLPACDHVNGTCFCFELSSSSIYPSIVVTGTPNTGFQAWWAGAIMAFVLVTISVIVVLLVAVFAFKRKRRKKKLVLPAPTENAIEETDVALKITRSKSLVRISQQGNSLSDVGSFKEPENLGSKYRWQIVLLQGIHLSTTEKANHSDDLENEPLDKELQELHANDTDDFEEVVFLKGVYLEPTATLKDLRNTFIDSDQLEDKHLFFQFLQSDTPGDIIPIDNEEEAQLKQFERQERIVYVQTIDKSAVRMELCVCGKFAELECTECKAKGYCSDHCQKDDWLNHVKTCRIVSARRREEKKQRKLKQKEEKLEMFRRTGYTPSIDFCRCGKDTVYECSNCGLQGYCSEECQTKDWKYHRLFCEQQRVSSAIVYSP